MLFTESIFLLFFCAAFGVHWLLPRNAWRKLWLLACSYAFYANWNWRFLSLILISTAIDYTVGRLLGRMQGRLRRRLCLAFSLLGNLGLLGFFKYYNFFIESATAMLESVGLAPSVGTLEIVLPVGISFYTFQTLSYTIDVYRGLLKPVRGLTDFALFVAFFPQLVAGPIVRASQFLPQLLEKRRFWNVEFRSCLTLFLIGYVKKACIADNFALVVDGVFADSAAHGFLDHWLAICMYALQIYCDFSGYSDMAIAVAGLLGYQLALNFDYPYLARSVTEFWRRWHISLSTWFRDYLYIPLGGNRSSRGRTYFNLVMVFFLCGLWHGASWNFVVWGLFHGTFLVLERVFKHEPGRWAFLGHAYTLAVALLAWVFFRAPDLPASIAYVERLIGLGSETGVSSVTGYWWLAVLLFALFHVAMNRRWFAGLRRLPDPAFSLAYGAAVALVLPWASADYQPFIYFQF